MTNMISYCLFCPITGAKAAITWSAPGWNHMTTPILQSYDLDLLCLGGADPGPRPKGNGHGTRRHEPSGWPVTVWVRNYLINKISKHRHINLRHKIDSCRRGLATYVSEWLWRHVLHRVRVRVCFWSLSTRSKLQQLFVTKSSWQENYPKIDPKRCQFLVLLAG